MPATFSRNRVLLGPDTAGYRVGVCWADSGIDTVTISDCHVILGYLNPDNFLGGQVKLDRQRAYDAMKTQIADPLGLTVEEAAAGVIELLDSDLRAMISGKGYSPSSFTCFSYGGAGPVHTYGYTYNAHAVSFTSGIWVMMAQSLIPTEMINDGAAYGTEFKLPKGTWMNPDDRRVAFSYSWHFLVSSWTALWRGLSRSYFGRG